MKIPTIKEIRDYYPRYLLAHKNKWNRRIHVVGNISTVAFIFFVLYASFVLKMFFLLPLLFLTPMIVYVFAWPAHKYIEKNKPATWTVNPLITKACDWIMMYDMLRGKIK